MGGYAFYVPVIGAAGVDLFFIISGFIVIYTNYDAFRAAGCAGFCLSDAG